MSDSTDTSGVQNWISSFPRDEAVARIAELEAELAQVKKAVRLHDSLTGGNGAGTPDDSGSMARAKNRPQAIQRIIRNADGPLKSGEIRSALIDQGWLERTENASKRFYTTMSRLTKDGRILRLEDGRYVMPSQGAAID